MAITANINRQTPLVAYVDFVLADLTSGTTHNAIHLPAGALVVSGSVDITTAFDSGTSDVIDVGDTVGSTPDVDRYSSTPVTASSAARVALSPVNITSGTIPSGGAWVTVTWTGDGTAATEGAARLTVEYIVDDRVCEYEAYRG